MEKNYIFEEVELKGSTSFTGFFNLTEEVDYLFIKLEFLVKKIYCHLLLYGPKGNLRVQIFSSTFEEENSLILHQETPYSSCGTVAGPLPLGSFRYEILLPKTSHPTSLRLLIEGGRGRPTRKTTVPLLGTSWATEKDGPLSFQGYPWKEKRELGQRWYYGDFHTHTTLSDGQLSPEELSSLARKGGLDFYVITEHNLFHTGFPTGDPLVIPGMEVSGSKGHFNILGCKDWIDWRISCEDKGCAGEGGMNRILRESLDSGAITCINHPFLEPWAWHHRGIFLDRIKALEIINDPTYSGNRDATQKALKLWDILWQEGFKVWGLGGSDCHLLPMARNPGSNKPSIIGDPLTCVFASHLSPNGILEAVLEGKAYVTRGPLLDIRVLVQEETFLLGSQLPSKAKRISLILQVKNLLEGILVIIINGEEVQREKIREGIIWKELELREDYLWLRLEIRDKSNGLLAATNPIFKGHKRPVIKTYGEALALMEKKYS